VTPKWVPGRAAAACALALVACGGGALAPDAGTGIILSPPPPFSIPPAPAAADLQLCDVAAGTAWPIGFLADGRALIGQSVFAASGYGTLVGAWDPRTNAVDYLFVAAILAPVPPGTTPLVISGDGNRIFEIHDLDSFRVYDADAGGLVSADAIPIDVTAVAGDGNFVMGSDFHVYTAAGDPVLDFSPLLPGDLSYRSYPRVHGLSLHGDAVAIGARDVATGAPAAIVVTADGRVTRLPDAPGFCENGYCGIAWSADGQRLLQFGDGGVRLWDLATGQLTARLDQFVHRAAFAVDPDRVITVDELGYVVERDLALAPTFTSAVVDPNAVFGPRGQILGDSSGALAIEDRGAIQGRWPRFGAAGWLGAVAIRDDDSFTIASELVQPAGSGDLLFRVRVERFARGKAGPVAVYRAAGSQSEWDGDLVLAPDESRIAALLPDEIAVLDAATLAPLARVDAGGGTITWSPDGRYLAATPDLHYRDSNRPAYVPAPEIAVWDATTGKLARRFATPAYPARVAFDERGSMLVGWGYPLMDARRGDDTGQGAPSPITTIVTSGDPVSFQIDVLTGEVATSALPQFVAATRELAASAGGIVAISTGRPIATLSAPVIRRGVFSRDFSLLLAQDAEPSSPTPIRLLGVADGHEIAALPTGYLESDRFGIALSRSGGRIQVQQDIYCRADRP
jgi:hypothetical protein